MMAHRIPSAALLALVALFLACSGDRTPGTPTSPGLSADRSGARGNADRKQGDQNQNPNDDQNDDRNRNQNPNRNDNENDDNNEQEFVAQLMPLNGSVGGGAMGEAELKVEHGTLTVRVETRGLAPLIVHMQHIHALHACPTAAADVNHDGIIDFAEGLPFYGAVLVPLDNDISNGTAQVYPTADAEGRIRYEASAPVATLEAALGQPLDLAHRAIVIHGVTGPLPGTVSPANPAALPVACGALTTTRR